MIFIKSAREICREYDVYLTTNARYRPCSNPILNIKKVESILSNIGEEGLRWIFDILKTSGFSMGFQNLFVDALAVLYKNHTENLDATMDAIIQGIQTAYRKKQWPESAAVYLKKLSKQLYPEHKELKAMVCLFEDIIAEQIVHFPANQ